ncbi:hypothetical protein [uncultured Corynebacterium sp.]|uniref:hypothetical protein n=1 Tax=uncultured Corynebacterium sp. TaxID=159447 RepID=UPI0025F6B322|nr:hypothetical protein [uncultured Corynebacterium sp.]
MELVDPGQRVLILVEHDDRFAVDGSGQTVAGVRTVVGVQAGHRQDPVAGSVRVVDDADVEDPVMPVGPGDGLDGGDGGGAQDRPDVVGDLAEVERAPGMQTGLGLVHREPLGGADAGRRGLSRAGGVLLPDLFGDGRDDGFPECVKIGVFPRGAHAVVDDLRPARVGAGES